MKNIKNNFILSIALIGSSSIVASDEISLKEFMDKYNIDESEVEVKGERLYKKEKVKFPWEAKCTTFDKRIFHGCIEARFFDPSARVYFDSGKDEDNEVDVFNDGGLNTSIDFVSVYIPWRFGRSEFFDSWSWGPMLGVGIGSPAQDSEDGTVEASGAPVVLASYGFMIEYKISDEGASFGFELGRAIGFSSDESFGDNDDSATYVGLKINIPTTKRSN